MTKSFKFSKMLKKIYNYFKTINDNLPDHSSPPQKHEHPIDYIIPQSHPFNGYFRYLAD